MELTALDRAEQLERRKWICGQKGGANFATPWRRSIGLDAGVDDFVGHVDDHHGRDDGDVGVAVGQRSEQAAPDFPARAEQPNNPVGDDVE